MGQLVLHIYCIKTAFLTFFLAPTPRIRATDAAELITRFRVRRYLRTTCSCGIKTATDRTEAASVDKCIITAGK